LQNANKSNLSFLSGFIRAAFWSAKSATNQHKSMHVCVHGTDDACNEAWDAQLHMRVSLFKLTRSLSCPSQNQKRYKSTTKIVNAILQLMTRVGVPSRVYSFFEVLGSYYALLIKGDDGRLPCQLICLSLKHTTKRTDYTTLSGHMCTLCFRQHCSHCITPIKIFC